MPLQPLLSKRSALSLIAGAALALSPLPLLAQDAAQKGYEIAARSDVSDNGFRDSAVDVTMELKNAAGQSSSRQLRILTLERASAKVGDKSISIFSTPADIDGTAVLSHAKLTANDDQWIYLPAAQRVKRISSSNKSGPFVGSEFAYEDITAQELGKFTYKWIGTENCPGGGKCEVVERVPTYKNSGYSKQVVWFSTKHWQAEKIDYYDRAGNHAKTMTATGIKKHNGFWRQAKLHMVNHRNGKSTTLSFANWRFGTGLRDGDFRSNALESLD